MRSATVTLQRLGDALNNRIGFGMNGGDVERIVAAANAQKASGLFERFGAEAGDGAQFERVT